MIIELQTDDRIVYSNATENDWMNTVNTAHILLTHKGDTLERIYTEEGQELYCHTLDSNGLHALLVAEYNAIEQEMTVYF